jgi:hypothetical protein
MRSLADKIGVETGQEMARTGSLQMIRRSTLGA